MVFFYLQLLKMYNNKKKEKDMKIVTEKQELKGTKMIIPIDGTISIDLNGVVDVSPKAAALLVKSISYWSFLKENKEQGNKEENKEQENEEQENIVDESAKELSEEEKIKKSLESKTLKQLLILVEELKIPVEEYKNIKNSKKLMVAFLLKKI